MARTPITDDHQKALATKNKISGFAEATTSRTLGSSEALEVAILDGSGGQITSFPVVVSPSTGTPSESAVAVTTTSTSVLSANSSRKYLQVINDSDTVIYVSIDGGAAAVNTGTRLNAFGGSAVWDTYVPAGAVTAIHGGTGAKTLLVTEG